MKHCLILLAFCFLTTIGSAQSTHAAEQTNQRGLPLASDSNANTLVKHYAPEQWIASPSLMSFVRTRSASETLALQSV